MADAVTELRSSAADFADLCHIAQLYQEANSTRNCFTAHLAESLLLTIARRRRAHFRESSDSDGSCCRRRRAVAENDRLHAASGRLSGAGSGRWNGCAGGVCAGMRFDRSDSYGRGDAADEWRGTSGPFVAIASRMSGGLHVGLCGQLHGTEPKARSFLPSKAIYGADVGCVYSALLREGRRARAHCRFAAREAYLSLASFLRTSAASLVSGLISRYLAKASLAVCVSFSFSAASPNRSHASP